MTNELPPTMVDPSFRSLIYYNYGNSLYQLKQYANAAEAYHESVSTRRTLVSISPAEHSYQFAVALANMGNTLRELGKHDDAIAAYKEVLDICTAMSAQDPRRYNRLMADTLVDYGNISQILNQLSEAAAAQKRAILLYRNLGHERTLELCDALHNYGNSCYALGTHAEAVLAYQESIPLWRAHAATDPEEEENLSAALHNIANCFNALGKYVEADAAAIEALERNDGRVFEWCGYAPGFKSCFVCQRVMKRVHRKRDKILGLLSGNRAQ